MTNTRRTSEDKLAHARRVMKATGNESLNGRCMVCGKATKGAFCSKECRAKYNAMVRANR